MTSLIHTWAHLRVLVTSREAWQRASGGRVIAMGMGNGKKGGFVTQREEKGVPVYNNALSASSMAEEDCETETHTHKDCWQRIQSPWLGTMINT